MRGDASWGAEMVTSALVLPARDPLAHSEPQ